MRRKYLILFLPLGIILANITAFFPELVEKIYAGGLYPFIGQGLSIATGFIPFSLGELIVVGGFLFFLISLIRLIQLLTQDKKRGKKRIKLYLLNVLTVISIIYFVFVITWGLNYNRLPFFQIANYEVEPISIEELALVCEDLIQRANTLREQVEENELGVMKIPGDKPSAFKRASLGYEKAGQKYPQLGGNYGPPKGVLISKVMAYAGISGVYFPFTGEANVNTLIPDSLLPATIAHEIAHQRGFAREDEANYIAYLVCTLHPDIDFQYSGVFLALRHAMNTLGQHDYERFLGLRNNYSEGILRDLVELSSFWEKYDGLFEKISTEINDIYLKANRQGDGVLSYNRMVDLLVAEYRARNR